MIVIGAGPGIGLAVARRFAAGGFDIGLVARSQSTLDAGAGAGRHRPTDPDATAHVGDADALGSALEGLVDAHGVPDVLVYNAAMIQRDEVGELSSRQHLDAWAVNVVGAIVAAGRIAPRMAQRGSGSIILTGGMPAPIPEVVSLSLGKAGLRALTELLATRYWPAGVHVATVTVGGAVEVGGTFDPSAIAEEYRALHAEPVRAWRREVAYTGCHSPGGRLVI